MSLQDADTATASSSSAAEKQTIENALNLEWSFGFKVNKGSGGVYALVEAGSTGVPTRLFYALGHTGIIYDHAKQTQTLLQGHCNAITASCVSQDYAWIVTADDGSESMVIVWNAATGAPIRTIFDPHTTGVCAIDISGDGKYIATLGTAADRDDQLVQEVKIWDWAAPGDPRPVLEDVVPAKAAVSHVKFSPERYDLVFNSEEELMFASWDPEAVTLNFVSPDVLEKINAMTLSRFVPGTAMCVTGTKNGELVIWNDCRVAAKVIQLHSSAVNAIACSNGMIVTGSDDGHVRIYDHHCRLLDWVEDINNGMVVSLAMPDVKGFQKGDTLPPFILGTSTGAIYSVRTDAESGDAAVVLMVHGQAGAVHALEAHPKEPLVAVGGHQGCIQLLDYMAKKVVRTFYFDKGIMVHTLRFTQDGKSIAMGATNGTVKMLNIDQDVDTATTFRPTQACVKDIIFSKDARYFATADDDNTVSLFKLDGGEWIWVGKHKSHTNGITGMLFLASLDNDDDSTLLSVGGDRYLVEYDIEASSITNGLRIRNRSSVEQSARPTAFFEYPNSEKESFIAMASDSYKIKLFNAKTRMCRRTILGPTYGCPIQDVKVLPPTQSLKDCPHQDRFVVYNTGHRVVGLTMLPLEGNPHKSMALIAHAGEVAATSASHDGRFIFTVGGTDGALNMWRVNTERLVASASLGGVGLAPYLGLLEGGRDGALFKEFEDFFYYAQLKAQGEDCKSERRVSSKVPVEQVANIMRGMGFYPTEEHINDMLNEVKFMKFVDTKESVQEITLEELVRLYLNHRPVEPLCEEDIASAVRLLGNGKDVIRKDELVHLLKNSGEYMTEEELAQHLEVLVGDLKTLPDLLDTKSITTELLKLAEA